jgi:hypothetical protein
MVAAETLPVTGHMNTNRDGQLAANAKRIVTWEQLREQLFRLAELGDELATVVAGPGATWLYREIETEAAAVAEVASAYIDECERLDHAPRGGGDRPAWLGAPSTRTTGGRALHAALPPGRRGALPDEEAP